MDNWRIKLGFIQQLDNQAKVVEIIDGWIVDTIIKFGRRKDPQPTRWPQPTAAEAVNLWWENAVGASDMLDTIVVNGQPYNFRPQTNTWISTEKDLGPLEQELEDADDMDMTISPEVRIAQSNIWTTVVADAAAPIQHELEAKQRASNRASGLALGFVLGGILGMFTGRGKRPR